MELFGDLDNLRVLIKTIALQKYRTIEEMVLPHKIAVTT